LGAITDGADYWAKILLDVLTGVILAVSLTMVNGFTGQFSIGHAAFMAVGAYTAACIVYYGSFRIWGDAAVHGGTLSTMMEGRTGSLLGPGDLLFVVALIAGGLTASLCGYLVGLPSLRLKGDYLAIVTLGFGEIVRVAIQQTSDTLYEAEEIAATPAWKFPKYIGGGLGFSGFLSTRACSGRAYWRRSRSLLRTGSRPAAPAARSCRFARMRSRQNPWVCTRRGTRSAPLCSRRSLQGSRAGSLRTPTAFS
jgi:ABC-type branched-subunit amino acid transport system permease subunit